MSSQNSKLERTSRYDQDVSETRLDYSDREANFRVRRTQLQNDQEEEASQSGQKKNEDFWCAITCVC